jgi:hypothetical protein
MLSKNHQTFSINYSTNSKSNFGYIKEIYNIGDICIIYPSYERG